MFIFQRLNRDFMMCLLLGPLAQPDCLLGRRLHANQKVVNIFRIAIDNGRRLGRVLS